MGLPSSSASPHKTGVTDTRPSIVVIEDNPTDVFLIREAITAQKLELDLHVVEDGEAALGLIQSIDENAQQPCPQLMLLDINLPKTDGFVVLARIRSSKRCAHIPVIVMTSSDAPTDRYRSEALGANAYFQKPSEYAAFLQLGDLVRKHLA